MKEGCQVDRGQALGEKQRLLGSSKGFLTVKRNGKKGHAALEALSYPRAFKACPRDYNKVQCESILWGLIHPSSETHPEANTSSDTLEIIYDVFSTCQPLYSRTGLRVCRASKQKWFAGPFCHIIGVSSSYVTQLKLRDVWGLAKV